jgi:RNA polymerase sigma factor (sigma-70 family)
VTGDFSPTLPLGPRSPVAEPEAAALVVRYQDGDPEALSLLHDRLGPIILSVLRPYRTATLPSAVTYQDVVQQTWIILAELAERWQPHGSFLAYFFRSFPRSLRRYVTVAGAHRGSKRARVVSVPYDELLRAADAHGGIHQESEYLLWRQQVEGLPPEQRVAITMHVLDGESFEVIGRTLGISRASAYRLYRRALESLGRTLADEHAPSSRSVSSRRGGRHASENREDDSPEEQHVEGPTCDEVG